MVRKQYIFNDDDSIEYSYINQLAINMVNELKSYKEIYKYNKYVADFTNILGNIFLYYTTSKSITRNPNVVDHYPFVVKKDYYNIKQRDFIADAKITKNIKKLGLSHATVTNFVFIAEQLNMIHVVKGYYDARDYNKSNKSYLQLKPLVEWNDKIFDSLNLYLGIAGLLYDGEYLKIKAFGAKHRIKDHTPAIVRDIAGNESPVKEDFDVVNNINNNLGSLKSLYSYRKIYSGDLLSGGRLYSTFHLMTKALRNKIMTKFGYKEIDFTAAILNTLHTYVTGEAFSISPYELVVDRLIKNKIDYNLSDDYRMHLKKTLKQAIVISFNSSYSSIKNNNNKLISDILIDSGLCNTREEIREAKSIHKNNYVAQFEYRYNKRAERWALKSNLTCPRFEVSVKNFNLAVKQALKSIGAFIGCKNWSWTQKIESETIQVIAEELIKKGNIPLLVHDAFYVKENDYDYFVQYANEQLKISIDAFRSVFADEENRRKVHEEFKEYVKSSVDTTVTIINNMSRKQFIRKEAERVYKQNKEGIEKWIRQKDRELIMSLLSVYETKALIREALDDIL